MATMNAPRLKNEDRPVIHKYVEVWLNEAVELMRPKFAEAGYEIPPVHLSVGFGLASYRVSTTRLIWGTCYPRRMDKDGLNQIFISPVLDDPMTVLVTLAHELVHAIDDCQDNHGPAFQQISKNLKLTDCRAVKMLDYLETVKFYRMILDQLGRYPRGGYHRRYGFLSNEAKPRWIVGQVSSPSSCFTKSVNAWDQPT
jgi:hypothetical protein